MDEERWSTEEAQGWSDVEKRTGMDKQIAQNDQKWTDEEIQR